MIRHWREKQILADLPRRRLVLGIYGAKTLLASGVIIPFGVALGISGRT